MCVKKIIPSCSKYCAVQKVHSVLFFRNAIGPLVAIWVIFSNGSVPETSGTSTWLLLFGGMGISIGVCVLGWKVIETVGSSLAVIIPSRLVVLLR